MSWMSKHAQRLWTREKPDGRHGWGALKWLLFGGLFVGGAIWFIHSMQGGGASSHAQAVIGNAPVAVNPAAKDVRIAEIAQAAQDTRPIVLPGAKGDSLAKAPSASVGSPTNDDKTPETSNDSMASFFGKPAAASSGQNAPKGTLNNTQPDTGNDSIFTALSRSSADADSADGRPVTDEDTASVKGKGQKGGRGGNGHSGPTEPGSPEADAADGKTERTMPSIEALMVKNIRPYPGQSSGSTGGYGAGSSTGHVMTHWLPRGEMVPVFLMQTVQTGNFPTLIEFAVAKTVWFLGKPILPFGTRFLATAGTGCAIAFNLRSTRLRVGTAFKSRPGASCLGRISLPESQRILSRHRRWRRLRLILRVSPGPSQTSSRLAPPNSRLAMLACPSPNLRFRSRYRRPPFTPHPKRRPTSSLHRSHRSRTVTNPISRFRRVLSRTSN